MATIVNIHEAKTHLSRLLDRVVAGEEIVIARAGKPLARLVRHEEDHAPRRPGSARGKVEIAPGFDELPEEIAAAIRGERT